MRTGEKRSALTTDTTQDNTLSGEITGDDILAYTVKRRFPLPVDAIYRIMPHFILLKVHGGLQYLKTKGTVIWITKHQGVWDQYFLRQLAYKIGGRRWEDVYPFAWGGDFPGRKGLIWRLKEIIMRILFLVGNLGHSYLDIRQGKWREDVRGLADEKEFVLLVSPEGPSIEMKKAELGAGVLQRDLKVPLIPIALWGLSPYFSKVVYAKAIFVEWLRCFPLLRRLPNPYFPEERVTANLCIGEPIYPFEDQGSHEERKKIYQIYTDRVMKKVASMLPEEFRGYYRDKLD